MAATAPDRRSLLPNWLAATGAAAAGTVVVLQQFAYRRGEAEVEAFVLRVLAPFSATVGPGSATIWTGLGTSHVMGFIVTPLCSTAPYAAAFLAVTTVLLIGRWSRLFPVVFGLVGALATMTVTNLLRLAVVILASRRWGQPGFEWTHEYVGTVIGVTGLFAAACIYIVSLLHGLASTGLASTGRQEPGIRS